MKSDLMDVVSAIQLSKAVIRNIRQNLFWAFFYNVIGIPLAAGVLYPFFCDQDEPDVWSGRHEFEFILCRVKRFAG